jgi:hypothetical protein
MRIWHSSRGLRAPPRHRSVKNRYARQQIDRTNRPKPLRLQVRDWPDRLLEAHRQVYEKLNATTASWLASYEGQAGAKVGNPSQADAHCNSRLIKDVTMRDRLAQGAGGRPEQIMPG